MEEPTMEEEVVKQVQPRTSKLSISIHMFVKEMLMKQVQLNNIY